MTCKNSIIKINNSKIKEIIMTKICNKRLKKLIKRLNKKWILNRKVIYF